MLRVGSKAPSEEPETPPQMPDQMAAASQPDVEPKNPSDGGSDHKQDLIEALTYMQMAMELIMNCLQKYQEEEGAPVDNGQEEADEETPGGGGAGPQGVPGY